VGLSILLFLLALVGIFSPVVDSNAEIFAKPRYFYFVGAALVVASVYLIYAHWSEKRRKKGW
jgi:protein-S-isoprenylcysteine O-methyltransferase Ste14